MNLPRFTVTEPGTELARWHGCTCPSTQPRAFRGIYRRAEDCPIHTLPHAFSSDEHFRQARTIEDIRDLARREEATRG